MKTLFIHNALPEYRIEFMKELSRILDIDFLITDPDSAMETYNIDTHSLASELKIDYLKKNRGYQYLKKKVLNGEYNVVVLPPADNIIQFMYGVYALKLAKGQGAKVVYWTEKWEALSHFQPFLKKMKNLIHRIMIGYLAHNATVCIAAGTKSAQYYRKLRIPEQKIKIAYDSSTSTKVIAEANLRQKYHIPDSDKVILYLGRLIERKGCDILIDAFSQLNKEHPDTFLVIGGRGDDYQKQCMNKIQILGIQNVVFTGLVDPQNRFAFYKMADVFVLPSYSLGGVIEAWGLTVNEALECGTPVVATTAVGAAYDLLDGKNGIMVEENSVDQLAKGIEEILWKRKHEELRKHCLAAAQKFSVANMAESFGIVIKGDVE